MAERKALVHYFPPDFDPAKIPRRKLGADRQIEVRLMAPFSMRCNTCGEYIYKGKKFNARKETVQGETYYGIKIFRFYIKCTQCSAEITFRTDPQNTDYKAEHGASRNFEPWRDTSKDEDDPDRDPLAHLISDEEDEAGDTMAALEQRTLDSKREMEIMDALQDIRTRNARNERVDADAVLDSLHKGKSHINLEEEEERRAREEDELLVRKYFSRDLAADDEPSGSGSLAGPSSASGSGSAPDGEGLPHTPDEATLAPASAAPIIKRARGADDEDEAEPEVAALLSEGMRAQLASARAGLAAGKPFGSGASKAAATNKLGVAPPAKRKKGVSAFGIVKKKA